MGQRKSVRGAPSRVGRAEQPTAPRISLRSTRIVMGASRDTFTLDLPGLRSPSGPEPHAASAGADVGRSAKITVRLAPHIARKMTAQARAAGLSNNVYLGTLIVGAPPVAADINGLVRLLRRGEAPSLREVESAVEALSSEFHAHLRHASRLIVDLAPLAAVGRAGAAEKVTPGGAAL